MADKMYIVKVAKSMKAVVTEPDLRASGAGIFLAEIEELAAVKFAAVGADSKIL